MPKLRLTKKKILQWADAYRKRTGKWPTMRSGRIVRGPGLMWMGVDQSLRFGRHGLRAGSSLARLLADRRGRQNRAEKPTFTAGQIFEWAVAYRRRTGEWPKARIEPIKEAPSETWKIVDRSLRWGYRGLPGGSSLPKLLASRRKVRPRLGRTLTIKQILAWADAYREQYGQWPSRYRNEVISGTGGDTWRSVNDALATGNRGLRGGTTLAQLLVKHRKKRVYPGGPRLTKKQIVAWAKAHERRTGRWPTSGSGRVRGVSGERWDRINEALRRGYRGLSGGSSLAKLRKRR